MYLTSVTAAALRLRTQILRVDEERVATVRVWMEDTLTIDVSISKPPPYILMDEQWKRSVGVERDIRRTIRKVRLTVVSGSKPARFAIVSIEVTLGLFF